VDHGHEGRILQLQAPTTKPTTQLIVACHPDGQSCGVLTPPCCSK
jgi:hypothetical protein